MTTASNRQLLAAFTHPEEEEDWLRFGVNGYVLIAHVQSAPENVSPSGSLERNSYDNRADAQELARWLRSQIANLNEPSLRRDVGTRFPSYTPFMNRAAQKAIFSTLATLNILCAAVALFAPLMPVNTTFAATIQSLTYSAAFGSVLILIAAVWLSGRKALWLFLFLPAAILWPLFMLISSH